MFLKCFLFLWLNLLVKYESQLPSALPVSIVAKEASVSLHYIALNLLLGTVSDKKVHWDIGVLDNPNFSRVTQIPSA